MKTVHGILSTGNEGDIVEQSLRHNLDFLNEILVLDNASDDGTVEKIAALQSEFPGRISLIRAEFKSPFELLYAVNHYRERIRSCSDFIFLLDADELIVGDNLDELDKIPPGGVGEIWWKTYLPSRLDHVHFAKEMRFRRSSEPEGCHKVVLRGDTDGSTILGNHYLHRNGARVPAVRLQSIRLAHFPVRSLGQMKRKIDFMTKVFDGVDGANSFHLRNARVPSTLEELVSKSLGYCDREGAEFSPVFDPIYGE